ncbi:FAD binding domain-containing protein [Burkholderia cenocepacia]|uniref:FAD binding domain-containing protein n=1 Tax=Burkholderia cenocepacia TaxID=95486 RepID=UPI001B970696|nr:FAD binding domain-containing protein [Burkholderia cenocepacia]MBR8159297.1 FAD binding domain-containing protein [Burkholderia cenocepacia]
MKPASFEYIRIDSAEEACALLAEHGDEARILAGGQSLVTVLNMRLAQPKRLLDISRTKPLDYVRIAGGKLAIGAAATQASVEWREHLAREVPVLALAFPNISHFQIRNRGTVCGSVAHADPSAELPLCLALLDGEVVLRSRRGARVLQAGDFFQGMLMTARKPDELVEEVRYPLASAGTGYAFEEFSSRHGDFAIVACAAAVNGDGIRLAVGGVADRPRVIALPRLGGNALDDALNDFAWELEARDDPHASASYRRHLVRQIGRRVVEQAGRAIPSAGGH